MEMAATILVCLVLILPTVAGVTEGCCEDLSKTLGSKVSYPASAAYNASIASFWSQQEQLITPSCVVSAKSVQDVSNAMRVLGPKSCKFAVRSGGHAALAGSANIQDGVTIDLSGLDWIHPFSNHSLVSIGPGQTWGKVYSSLDALGVSVPGGRDGPVGVGGTTLGGGFGYFATKAGFACNNIVAYELVLANGTVVNATRSRYSDLWMALKGGSNSFGIVTNFVFQTFPLGAIWGGDIYYNISTIDAQLEAFYRFTSNPSYDTNAGLLHNFAYTPEVGPLIVNQYAYAKPDPNPATFRAFILLQPQISNTTQVSSLETLSVNAGKASPNSFQQITFAVTFTNELAMLQELFTIWNSSTSEVSAVAGIKWSLTLVPIVPAITFHSAIKGSDVLGLSVPPQGLVLTLLSASFNSSDDYSMVNRVANRLSDKIIRTAKEFGVYNTYVDLNHGAAWQDPIASYGSESVAFLQRTAQKYDPTGVFQTQCPGGFKVFGLERNV
ncbi:hypothetical protein BDV28DRAFT_37210 [Aspergillus coremiiformis]|uniref:FAD-binding PCMH-type domain-containing protein n=1 Tax=Aspergillus coremiiformis TaxID=138285 RepID=A0A5N6YYJ5_9EURO|nr:hypothetical protein BDV28DRAFT_37210 [Aspergillus coremiiformis]